MKKNIIPLFPERLYHIYNRGINGENIFREERNYQYFLDKYKQFVLPVAHLYAYCLLKNHFHFMILVKTEAEIQKYFEDKKETVKTLPPEQLVSRAFNSFFKSYSITINKTYGRTGGLFEEPFLRVEVTHNRQITNLITYIHQNPQKHGFTKDFKNYPYSSYQELLNNSPNWIAHEKVMDWFGGAEEFKAVHSGRLAELPKEVPAEYRI